MTESRQDDGGGDHAENDSGGLARIERAFAAFMNFEGAADDPAARAAFLSAHEDLRDLLEPMIDGDAEEAEQEVGADPAADSTTDHFGTAHFGTGHTTSDGEFRLVREIGRGGMGVVWEAQQIALSRRVALKALPPSFALSPRAIARFRREAAVMAKLDHPHLVRVLAVGQDDGVFWFAMELIDGQPLDALIEERHFSRSKAGAEQATRISAEIADALEHAHRAGIVHRDVKPANIMIRASDGAAVLTDFGLAREDTLPSLTAEGSFAGTPYYIAPEQIDRPQDVDARADVFSLGATLFEMLTGQRAFDAPSTHGILEKIRSRDPVSARSLSDFVSVDLAAVLSKALEKSPHHRYASAGALQHDLRASLDARPVNARPIGTATRWLRAARREPLKAGLLAAALLGGLATTGVGGYLLANQNVLEAGTLSLREADSEQLLTEGFAHLADREYAEAEQQFSAHIERFGAGPEAVAGYGLVNAVGRRQDRVDDILRRHATIVDAHPDLERIREIDFNPDAAGRAHSAEPVTARRSPTHIALLVDALIRSASTDDPALRGEHFDLWSEVIATSNRPRLFHHVQRCSAAGASGDADKIRAAVNATLSRWPESARAQMSIGYALSFVDFEAAREAFETALKTIEGNATLHANYGIVLERLGAIEEGITELRRAIEIRPKYAEARLRLAQHLHKGGESDAAIEQLETAIQLNPERADFYRVLAQFYAVRGDRERALEFQLKASERAPGDLLSLRNLGIMQLQTKRTKAGVASLQKAAAIDPGDFMTWINLATPLRFLGRDAEAIEAARQATRTRPEEPHAWLIYGKFVRKSDPVESVYALRRAVELRPEHGASHYRLALSYGDLQRWKDAEQHFGEALKHASERFQPLFQRGTPDEAMDPSRAARARAMASAAAAHAPTTRWCHDVILQACTTVADGAAARAEHERWVSVHAEDSDAWHALALHCFDRAPIDIVRGRAAVAAGLATLPDGATHPGLQALKTR